MRRAIILFLAVLAAAWPLSVYAATGFSGWNGGTGTERSYYMDTDGAFLIYNKELAEYVDPDEIYAGSDLYIPLMVEPQDADAAIATAKQVKDDEVSLSFKALRGENYVGDAEIIDSKKLKRNDIPAGSYIRIPFLTNYDGAEPATVRVQVVLSVHGVSYQDTRMTFECKLVNRAEEIDSNSVYGAKKPTLLKVSRSYRGDATFDFGNNIKYTVGVKPSQRIYLNLSREPNETVAAMYPGAYLDFYSFLGESDKFDEAGELQIPIDRQKFTPKNGPTAVYVYRVKGETLESIGTDQLFYNRQKSVLTMLTPSLDEYVLSNQALMKTVNEEDDILRSGYAQTPEGSLQDVGSTAEPGTQQITPAETQQPQAQQAAPTAGENPPTGGGPINAANHSSENPATGGGPGAPVAAAAALALIAGLRIFIDKNNKMFTIKTQ